jgi:hypothetical protein
LSIEQLQEKCEAVFRPELRRTKGWSVFAIRRKAERLRKSSTHNAAKIKKKAARGVGRHAGALLPGSDLYGSSGARKFVLKVTGEVMNKDWHRRAAKATETPR